MSITGLHITRVNLVDYNKGGNFFTEDHVSEIEDLAINMIYSNRIPLSVCLDAISSTFTGLDFYEFISKKEADHMICGTITDLAVDIAINQIGKVRPDHMTVNFTFEEKIQETY